jgi:MinD superfamily P-loop ATPase
MPQIDYEKCDGCGICVTVCSCKALIIEDNIVKFKEPYVVHQCNRWCNNCELVCPNDAISCPFDIVIEE